MTEITNKTREEKKLLVSKLINDNVAIRNVLEENTPRSIREYNEIINSITETHIYMGLPKKFNGVYNLI